DVGLVDGGDVLAALLGDLEGQADDAADLVLVVDEGVEAEALAVADVAALGMAEVDAAGQLTDEEQVDVLGALGLEGRGVLEAGDHLDGADVREEAEVLAHAEQALLGAHRGAGVVPLGAADGAEEDGVRALEGAQGLLRQRGARLVDGDAADELLVVLEGVAELLGDRVEDLARGADDLGADAVAGEEGDLRSHDASRWAAPRAPPCSAARAACSRRPCSMPSTSAIRDASMMLLDAPTVLHV